MEIATDAATDRLVRATQITSRRRYRCPRCHADVILKAGASNVAHFAHAKGEADPACENYFSSIGTFSGGYGHFAASDVESLTRDVADLFFEVGVFGPRLLVWLPPSGTERSWSGTVQVEAHQLTRRLTAHHLEHGQFVPFGLFDGQWRVSVEGDVSDSYVARLHVGTGSLESGINLFDASRTPCHRLGPSAPVRLGDSYWLIVRSAANLMLQSSGLDSWERIPGGGGWTVYYLELPVDAPPESLERLAAFFQRQVAPARAKVWVERPWPFMMREGFVPVFAWTHTYLEVRADCAVDLSIRPVGGGAPRLTAAQTQSARWSSMEVGRWELCVNGLRYLGFEVAEGGPSPGSPIVAQLDSQPSVAFAAAQEVLEALVEAHAPPRQIHLSWDHPAITRLLKVNGAPVSGDVSTLTFVLAHYPVLDIDADNLGHFVWRNPVVASPVVMPKFAIQSTAAPRARWLLSLASRHNVSDSIRIVVPERLRGDIAIARLHGLWLPMKYAPHLNALLTDARTRV